MSAPATRIGLLGGTFDPVHFAHLRVAVELRERLGLDRVDFLPNHRPVHRGRPGAAATQRLAMLELALEGVSGLGIDLRELRRETRSFTVDTLRGWCEAHGPQVPVFFLGTDAFANFDSWQDWETILELAHLVVMDRPGAERSAFATRLLAERSGSADRPVGDARGLDIRAGRIDLVDVTQLDISATAIREHVAAGRDTRFLLPEAVRAYMYRHGLYLDRHPTNRALSRGEPRSEHEQ